MDRRTLLLGGSALLLAGCARIDPPSSSASPSPASPRAAAVGIGIEQTATGALLGALLVGAVAKTAVTAVAQPSADPVAALQSGSVVLAPAWASTVWAALSDAEELPQDVLGDLAALLEPKVSVLQPGLTDGGLLWMASAASGQKSLEDLSGWSKGKAAAIPAMAIDRSDGLGALNAVYRANFQALTIEDPVARAAAVANGRAGVGVFRRTEYLGEVKLVELIDPDQICGSDQLVLLASAAYADASAEQVLAMNAVVQKLTSADLVALSRQVATGTSLDQVAHQWLVGNGLA